MSGISEKEISLLNKLILEQEIPKTKLKTTLTRLKAGEISTRQYIAELILSPDYLKLSREKSTDLHLYFAHSARLKLVTTLLPRAETILDLGGANGSIYDMGYPHKFRKITIVDLLPTDRVEMYKKLKMKAQKTPNGVIDIHYGDMSDLSFAKDNSVDLVWSGESVEHIPQDAGRKMLKEAFRVLKPGGFLCLDTPNRLVTEIHTRDAGVEFIHPEHKIEYTPKQLTKMIKNAGFNITESRGICEMKRSFETKQFDYTDFVTGNPLPHKIESAYMQYYRCQKPYPLKARVAGKLTPETRQKLVAVRRKLKR